MGWVRVVLLVCAFAGASYGLGSSSMFTLSGVLGRSGVVRGNSLFIFTTGTPPSVYEVSLASEMIVAGPTNLGVGGDINCSIYDSGADRIYAVSATGHVYRINPSSLTLDGTVRSVGQSPSKAVVFDGTYVWIGSRQTSRSHFARLLKSNWDAGPSLTTYSLPTGKTIGTCGAMLYNSNTELLFIADGQPSRLQSLTLSEWATPTLTEQKM